MAGRVYLSRIASAVAVVVLVSCGVLAGCSDLGTVGAANAKATEGPPSVVKVVSLADVEALFREARGSVLVINFWATWCPPCVAEMPELAAFHAAYAKKAVSFLSLSVDDPEVIANTVVPFARKRALSFPVYVLREPDLDAYGSLLKTELSGAVPVTLVYDKEGRLKSVREGGITREQLGTAVDGLL